MTHTINMYNLTNMQLWICQFPPLMFPLFFDIHTPLPLLEKKHCLLFCNSLTIYNFPKNLFHTCKQTISILHYYSYNFYTWSYSYILLFNSYLIYIYKNNSKFSSTLDVFSLLHLSSYHLVLLYINLSNMYVNISIFMF